MNGWVNAWIELQREVERKQPARKIEIAGGGEMGEKS